MREPRAEKAVRGRRNDADASPVRFLIHIMAVALSAVALGLGTAWYAIDSGLALSTAQHGPWWIWYRAGDPDADPYTRAHLARSGRLPLTSANAHYYFADRDEEGRPLRALCEYAVEGPGLPASWWSLSLYNSSGRLIPNKAARHAFNSRDMMRDADGSFRVTLAPQVRPGNWLPTGERDQRLMLVLRVYATRSYAGGLRQVGGRLPRIAMVAC